MANITIKRVLEAIVKGNHSGKDVSNYTKIHKGNISRYFKFMEREGLIDLMNTKAFITEKGNNFFGTTSSVRKKNNTQQITHEKITLFQESL